MTDKEWEEKRNLYIKIHDAVVRDNEKLYAENVRLKNAVAAEREACARVCEPQFAHDDPLTAFKIAEAIRARGQHD